MKKEKRRGKEFLNKYIILFLILAICFDLTTTFIGFSFGLEEGNPFGMTAIYGSAIIAFLLFVLYYLDVRISVKTPYKLMCEVILIISGSVRVGMGLWNLGLIWLVLSGSL